MTLIQSATLNHRRSMADMFARAFQDDLALQYIIPDPFKRSRSLPHLFEMLIGSDARAGMQLVTHDCAAAALWRRSRRYGSDGWS